MEKAVIKATRRQVIGKRVGAMRRSGELPAVLYGRRVDPTPITLNAHDATLTLARATSSSIITIELDGKEYPALVREKQRDFIKNHLLHVDFLVLSLTEKTRAQVGIELTGSSPAVKNYNAVLVTGLNELEVECLPQDLPERIVLDVSGLAEIGDSIHVRDVVVSDKVEILTDPDEIIVSTTAQMQEEEIPEEAPVEEEAEPEVIERGRKEEEEGEGEDEE
jgi:large subunit ribosomal protein L25